MTQIKYFKFSILILSLVSLPLISGASALKKEIDKSNACKGKEGSTSSAGYGVGEDSSNNSNATDGVRLGAIETGGKIGEVKTKMMEKEEKYAGDPRTESDPKAKKALEELQDCIDQAKQAESAANKQAEEAKKSNEEKGSGGGMPDLSSLLSALKKEKKPEEPPKEQALDCSNPASSSNPVCMCQINPRSNGCGNQEQQDYANAKKEKKSREDGPSGSNSPLGSSFKEDRQPSKSGSTPPIPGGGGGSGGGVGSGAGGPAGNDNAIGAPAAKVPGVIEGSYGGGGGGSRAAGGGYRADTPLGRSAAAIQRNLASVGRRGQINRDGLTGPHTDLFKKVRTRYLSVRGSLNP